MQDTPRTTLVFIRHGETVWNREERFQGHGDSALTETGRSQAQAVGRRLRGVSHDLMISSDLGRTVQTAEMIAEFTGDTPSTDSRLRERNYGVLEGMRIPDILEKHPEAFRRLMADDPDYTIAQGESHRQHYDRTVAFIEGFLAARPGRTAFVVAHGGVLDNIFRFVAGLPLNRPRCSVTPNASLNVITNGFFYGTRRWVIESWGDVSHLNGLYGKNWF